MSNIIVSACLLGIDCRYKGDSCPCQKVIDLGRDNQLIPVCPEQLGGLPTPRTPSEISGDRVIMKNGNDVTEEYKRGAAAALQIAKLSGAGTAILKANSPSCGKGIIYDGTFTGNKTEGNGITCALLMENGIRVFTEDETDLI